MLTRNLTTEFVKPVTTLVTDIGMNHSNALSRLLPITTPLLLTGVLTLHFSQFALLFSVELRGSGLLAIATGYKGFQSRVQTDRRERLPYLHIWSLEMANEDDVPLARRFLSDSGGLDVSLHLPMQEDGNETNLWNVDLPSFRFDPLGDAKSVWSTPLALKAGEFRSVCEEVLVGGAKVFEDLLEGLSVAFIEEV